MSESTEMKHLVSEIKNTLHEELKPITKEIVELKITVKALDQSIKNTQESLEQSIMSTREKFDIKHETVDSKIFAVVERVKEVETSQKSTCGKITKIEQTVEDNVWWKRKIVGGIVLSFLASLWALIRNG